MTIDEFIEKNRLTSEPVFGGLQNGEWNHFAWSVIIRKPGKSHVEQYRCGTGHAKWRTLSRYELPSKERNGRPMARNYTFESIQDFLKDGRLRPTPPKLEDVFDSIRSDCESIEQCPLFEDWADSLGYDQDSRKAEGIFRACCEIRMRMLAFLGQSAYLELLGCEPL